MQSVSMIAISALVRNDNKARVNRYTICSSGHRVIWYAYVCRTLWTSRCRDASSWNWILFWWV